MFITFYSYKGGVGRSLALANIACLMAEDEDHPQRVLVWDFDLEAPGLHKLFLPKEPQNYGFVDLAYKYATTKKMPKIDDYIYESEIENLYVLPAGKIGKSYCDKLQHIDWLRFFGSDQTGTGPFFGKVIDSIKNSIHSFDYVLIDSRTGLNDQAGICTQVLSELLIILFRLSTQDFDGLEHLVPAIKSQLKARGKDDVMILPIASQVGAAASRSILELRKKAIRFFEQPLEYIRFDQDLVSKEMIFCHESEIEEVWPVPPIVEDYRRICEVIRNKHKSDTRTETEELRRKMREGDYTSASTILVSLLNRRPRLSYAWAILGRLFDNIKVKTRRDEFETIVSKILKQDKENFFAFEWQATFQASSATSPNSPNLNKARKALKNALKYAPIQEKSRIYTALTRIESCQGDLKNALSSLRKAQSLLPDNRQINLDLAMLHMRMGSQYFAVAEEELDQMPSEIGGDEKYRTIAYIRAFLGEKEKALKALEKCSKSFRALSRAHLLLIEGDKKQAVEMAEKKISGETDPGEVANWSELLLCSGEFDKAINAIDSFKKRKSFEGDISSIQKLAYFFKEKDKDYSDGMTKLISDWDEKLWNFIELLIFKERCKRDNIDYGGRLEVIEQLIRSQELQEIRSPLGLFTGRGRLRATTFRVKLSYDN
ncbi:MAG: KGGVGR-motif variant AAA ATPase [Planctomycetota bacterium]|jgi:MinD-like ATPase involved in chromosome partitioning or flagellar assembly